MPSVKVVDSSTTRVDSGSDDADDEKKKKRCVIIVIVIGLITMVVGAVVGFSAPPAAAPGATPAAAPGATPAAAPGATPSCTVDVFTFIPAALRDNTISTVPFVSFEESVDGGAAIQAQAQMCAGVDYSAWSATNTATNGGAFGQPPTRFSFAEQAIALGGPTQASIKNGRALYEMCQTLNPPVFNTLNRPTYRVRVDFAGLPQPYPGYMGTIATMTAELAAEQWCWLQGVVVDGRVNGVSKVGRSHECGWTGGEPTCAMGN